MVDSQREQLQAKKKPLYDNYIYSRVTELSKELGDDRRRRDADLSDLRSATKQASNLSDAEKQRLIVQISAVQTELQSTLESRDAKLRGAVLQRIENLELGLADEAKDRQVCKQKAVINAMYNKAFLRLARKTSVLRWTARAHRLESTWMRMPTPLGQCLG